MRNNSSLIATAVRLHAERRVPAGCYVVDVDTVAAQIWAVLRARLSATPVRSVASPA